ncbi:MAG TPA: WecB/TagA/CpsF family glycosyltransferase [Chthonomonadaceae bacterium]|nr:WecB/TagA/CpsF family glycosyltransferase [Chthonomonadaceae bacterium]
MRNIVSILQTPIDRLDMQGVLARIETFLCERGFHQVATANTDYLVNALYDPELREILQAAHLITPDGMPVVWASRLLGNPLSERVTGADLVPQLALLAARKGYRLYLLGAQPEVNTSACDRLRSDYPGLQIVGSAAPPDVPLETMANAPLLADIARTRPDILLVAFGNPKQEKWIYRNRERLQEVPVCIGVGATFDFLAGRTRRAPLWMQRRGLEWLHRLAQEPRRLLKRYHRDFWLFGYHLLRQWRMQRRSAPASGASPHRAGMEAKQNRE